MLPKKSSDAGTYEVTVEATDAGIGGVVATQESVSAVFVLEVGEVNDVPEAPAVALAKQEVDEDVASDHASATYEFDAFTDEETSPLTYTFSVKRVVGNVKTDVSPTWITLVSTTRTFTFAPKKSSDAGTYEVTVLATDAGIGGVVATKKSVSAVFVLEVGEVNDVPEAPAGGLARQEVDEDVKPDHATATYRVPAFTDEETSPLTYTFSVKRVEDDDSLTLISPPPDWIEFDDDPSDDDPLNPTFRTFTFTPKLSTHAGRYKVRVRGTDSGGSWAEDEFEVVVVAVNDAPQLPAGGLARQDG